MKLSPFAVKPAKPSLPANMPRLATARSTEAPDPSVPGQRVAFGTSGHRGSGFEKAFNEWARRILEEAQTIVNDALVAAPQRSGLASDTNSEEGP